MFKNVTNLDKIEFFISSGLFYPNKGVIGK